MAIDPTIPLPAKFTKLFDIVASQLPVEEAFLFRLVKCHFNASTSIDNHFTFHRAIFAESKGEIRSAIHDVEQMVSGTMTEDMFEEGCRLASVALFGLKVQEACLLHMLCGYYLTRAFRGFYHHSRISPIRRIKRSLLRVNRLLCLVYRCF